MKKPSARKSAAKIRNFKERLARCEKVSMEWHRQLQSCKMKLSVAMEAFGDIIHNGDPDACRISRESLKKIGYGNKDENF